MLSPLLSPLLELLLLLWAEDLRTSPTRPTTELAPGEAAPAAVVSAATPVGGNSRAPDILSGAVCKYTGRDHISQPPAVVSDY